MKFELLIFDWDGTLMDSEAHIIECVEAAVRDLNLPLPGQDAIRDIIGLGLQEAVNTLFPSGREGLHLEVAARYRAHFFKRKETPSELFEGTREVLDELLQQGYLLAVATGKGRKGLDYALESTGLGEFFHLTRCADETFSKPHPEMLHQILEQTGVEPRQALMIGDTEYDLEMAVNAGVPSLGVTYGTHSLGRLLKHNPLACVDRVTEIPAWLNRG
ncbi:HAD-IA family hydrolase [Candidatus Thiodiazotropha sp. CDECU1]|uniref:HAD-IA family hydrolase n=1 Tax=Candidatus Thiodiazotropha sp. CDECU1 TaxID=3065865 RepID=UPI00293062B0|nr:HAD-IA family hydrolase [Candidatus Thiodiazotropha sp. CDECU1]